MLLFLEDATTFNRQFPLDRRQRRFAQSRAVWANGLWLCWEQLFQTSMVKKQNKIKISAPVDSMRSASRSVPDQVLIAIKGSCMKECAWPCSHDCHTLNKWGYEGKRDCAGWAQMLISPRASCSLLLCFFFFFSLRLTAVWKKAVTRDSRTQQMSQRQEQAVARLTSRQGLSRRVLDKRTMSEKQVTVRFIWLMWYLSADVLLPTRGEGPRKNRWHFIVVWTVGIRAIQAVIKGGG